jgi:DNA processing protein
LLLSQFQNGFEATPWSFVLRNEVVVALGDVLVIGEADIGSGTMRSAEFALAMGKEIFVLPHRLDESLATNKLLKDGLAKAIYDIDEFVERFGDSRVLEKKDEFLEYCKTNPTYEEAIKRYPQKIFEAELMGEVKIINGIVFI